MNHTDIVLKWHKHSPISNNFSLLIGKKPFSFPSWRNKGVNVLKDLFNSDGLRAFSDLQAEYDLPGSSFFYLFATEIGHESIRCPLGPSTSSSSID